MADDVCHSLVLETTLYTCKKGTPVLLMSAQGYLDTAHAGDSGDWLAVPPTMGRKRRL